MESTRICSGNISRSSPLTKYIYGFPSNNVRESSPIQDSLDFILKENKINFFFKLCVFMVMFSNKYFAYFLFRAISLQDAEGHGSPQPPSLIIGLPFANAQNVTATYAPVPLDKIQRSIGNMIGADLAAQLQSFPTVVRLPLCLFSVNTFLVIVRMSLSIWYLIFF